MSTQGRSQFVVRQLRDEPELTRCLELDHTYYTEYVWQMDSREEKEDTVVRFRTVHLPRQMHVNYPRPPQVLTQLWKQRDCFLVAAVEDVILGYVNMRVDRVRASGWVHDLVVDARLRRRRIGSALLVQALRWARLHEIDLVTVELQTKNVPAIDFVRSHGFSFCGFNDHYYLNRDIALFFSRNL